MKRKYLMKIVMTLLVIFVITVSPVLAMTYSYDDLGRLTSVTYDFGQNTTYSYDSAGNMLSATNSLSNKLITSYSLAAQTGPAIIDNSHRTVAVTVSNGTDVTNLVATFTLSGGATAQVGSTVQVSGTTANNFTNPVIYKVTSADGSELDWTVTVTAGVPSETITETLTVSNTTGSAFTVALSPALNGLQTSDFILMDDQGQPVNITTTTTTNSGITYTISATFAAGKTYTITGMKSGYTFGSPQNVVVPTGTIAETLTVSSTTGSGITIALSPALVGLQTSDFILLDDQSQPVNFITATTTNSGVIYTISATLTAGKTYLITATKSGYDFGTAQTVVVPSGTIIETLTVSNTTGSGITVALSPALVGLTTSNFTLKDSLNNPVTITGATSSDGGVTYVISAVLSAGQTYTLMATKIGYDFGTAQNVLAPTP